jgi:hypothetical protein
MAIFWIKIIAFVGVLAVFFGMSSTRLRNLIFRKGKNGDE